VNVRIALKIARDQGRYPFAKRRKALKLLTKRLRARLKKVRLS
jgi:hypothetical protein